MLLHVQAAGERRQADEPERQEVAAIALRVAVQVQHAVPAPGTPIGPVPVGIADSPQVRVEIAHVFGDQSAALETGHAARDQATLWLRGRELDGRAQRAWIRHP